MPSSPFVLGSPACRALGASLAIASLILTSPAPASAQRGGVAKAEPPDLRKSFERRLKKLLGVEVSIDSLRYDLFASTFLGRGIRVGPARRPYLRLPRLRVKVKVSLLRPAAGTIPLIEVRGAKVTVPLAWLGRELAKPATGPFEVHRLQVTDGTIELSEPGNTITLEGVEIGGSNVAAPAARAGAMPPLKGRVVIGVKRARLGKVVLTGVQLRARFAKRALKIEELSFKGGGGEVRLAGEARLGRRRPVERLQLAGEVAGVKLIGDAPVSGKISVAGRWGRGLTISGKLGSEAELVPTKGGAKIRLPLQAKFRRLRVGKRRLRGTLRSWRLR